MHFLKMIGFMLVTAFFFSNQALAECKGYSGPGGPCYTGPGGGLYTGPGGGAYTGPGGGAYTGPGGGAYTGPGGGAYTGPGGGAYTGPGGGASFAPTGEIKMPSRRWHPPVPKTRPLPLAPCGHVSWPSLGCSIENHWAWRGPSLFRLSIGTKGFHNRQPNIHVQIRHGPQPSLSGSHIIF